jgi:hypothetical protein
MNENKHINDHYRIWVNPEDFTRIPWENKIHCIFNQPLTSEKAHELMYKIMMKLKQNQTKTFNFVKFTEQPDQSGFESTGLYSSFYLFIKGYDYQYANQYLAENKEKFERISQFRPFNKNSMFYLGDPGDHENGWTEIYIDRTHFDKMNQFEVDSVAIYRRQPANYAGTPEEDDIFDDTPMPADISLALALDMALS